MRIKFLSLGQLEHFFLKMIGVFGVSGLFNTGNFPTDQAAKS